MTRLAILLAMLVSIGCAAATRSSSPPPTRQRGLTAFASMKQLRQQMAEVSSSRLATRKQEMKTWGEGCRAWAKSDFEVGVTCSSGSLTETVQVSAAGSTVDSITNNQHEGADEGGIVKRRGDVLVILRRGRLFTIWIGAGGLKALDAADAFGAANGARPEGTWYDELLVWENTVVVIGYSYSRGGTEIGLFNLDPDGHLEYRATYHLRSDDYYSGSGYASRLIGDKLLLFSSARLPDNADPNAWLPSLRRWNGRSKDPFESIAPLDRVYQPVRPLGAYPTIHTLISCGLAAPDLRCEGTVLLGEPLSVYYASPKAAYAWTTAWTDQGAGQSMLYRLPFDSAPVSAVGVSGTPPDHLAFLEDAEGYLNVATAHGESAVKLFRFPIAQFSDGSVDAGPAYYRSIANTLGPWFSTRFVGRHVLIGAPEWADDPEINRRQVLVTARAEDVIYPLQLTHDVERIEAMGEHAVVVGSVKDRGLSMTAVRLESQPRVEYTLLTPNSSESENRSHAFFYRQDTFESGLFGLPIVTGGESSDGETSTEAARVMFVRNHRLTFAWAGTLDAARESRADDGCKVSCADWYGHARPIFIGDRIFALLGYEIIEGQLQGELVREVQRVRFLPGDARAR